MKKFEPDKKVRQIRTRINVPVNYVSYFGGRSTNYAGLQQLRSGDWRLFACDGTDWGYVVQADMDALIRLVAEKMGYRLVKQGKEKR
jgi:hypothetical protein